MAELSVADALARLLVDAEQLPFEPVPVEAAAGRILAKDLNSRLTLPPFDASAMDGYAIKSAESAGGTSAFKVAGTSAAGAGYRGVVRPGEAIRILTGAPVPDGADTVVMQELVTRDGDGDVIRLDAAAKSGSNIRPKGGNTREGQTILNAGRRLTPRDVMLAASAGFGDVPVVRRPRVAILATGDELVPPGATPGPDQIVASNSVGLAALLTAFGAEVLPLGIAPDDEATIAARARDAHSADILITSGGVSVGDHDHVKPALLSLGMSLDFWKIAMRPGKPLMVGRLGTRRVVGLPGNPISAMVAARLFVVPLIRAMLGLDPRDRPEMIPCGTDLPPNGPRQHYTRATLTRTAHGPTVTPLPDQDSSLTLAFAAADALLIREPGAPPATKGTLVSVLRLDF